MGENMETPNRKEPEPPQFCKAMTFMMLGNRVNLCAMIFEIGVVISQC